jgi:hypothetical protein
MFVLCSDRYVHQMFWPVKQVFAFCSSLSTRELLWRWFCRDAPGRLRAAAWPWPRRARAPDLRSRAQSGLDFSRTRG